MTRALIAFLMLSGCADPIEVVRTGYVMRSASVNASKGSIGFTVTFDNVYLPQTGGDCIGIEVCTTTVD